MSDQPYFTDARLRAIAEAADTENTALLRAMANAESDPILDAVRFGEDRAERQWFTEHRQPLPRRLWPAQCQHGQHIIDQTFAEPIGRCAGCNQTEDEINDTTPGE